MNHYQQAISKATKVTDLREIKLIEEVMRSDRPTLDSLRAPEFNKLARAAKEALKDTEFRGLMESMYPAV